MTRKHTRSLPFSTRFGINPGLHRLSFLALRWKGWKRSSSRDPGARTSKYELRSPQESQPPARCMRRWPSRDVCGATKSCAVLSRDEQQGLASIRVCVECHVKDCGLKQCVQHGEEHSYPNVHEIVTPMKEVHDKRYGRRKQINLIQDAQSNDHARCHKQLIEGQHRVLWEHPAFDEGLQEELHGVRSVETEPVCAED